jgi:hypothetical protein
MSKLRSVSTQFWSDPWIEDLSANEKLLYLYFITNEKTNMLGVYELSIKKISFETGLNKDVIEKALKGFERVGKVKYIQNYVVLLNFTKHQNYNTNMKISAIDVYNNLPNFLKVNIDVIDKSKPLEGFERVCKGLGMVRKVEVESEVLEDETEGEQEKPTSGFDFLDSLIQLGVDKQVADDWIKVRAKHKASNTQTAFKKIVAEIEKSGRDANWCITKAVEKSWRGFEAEWVKPEPVKKAAYPPFKIAL